MLLVFDLDDTLYPEISFVKSGFRAVSQHLFDAFAIPPDKSFHQMCKLLEANGRGAVFNDLLKNYGVFNKKNLKKCLSVYRLHTPEITLSKSAIDCLNRFRNERKYIVTDGNKIVQRNKIIALNLPSKVDFYFITHRYGIKNAKPSPYCFLKICSQEHVKPKKVCYIGDNPLKDFKVIRQLGFHTIRLHQGAYKDIRVNPAYDAHHHLQSLDEVTKSFINSLK